MINRKTIFYVLILVLLLLVSAFAIRQALTPDIKVVVGVPTAMENGHVSGVSFGASPLRDAEEVRTVIAVLLQGREVPSPEFAGTLPDAVLMVEGPENINYFVDVWLREDSLFYAPESTEAPVFHQSNVYVAEMSAKLKK